MLFSKNAKEEKYEYKGRCVLVLSVCITLPRCDESCVCDAESKMTEILCSLYEYAFADAKDSYLRAAEERYDSCVLRGERAYPVRVSIDISPVSTGVLTYEHCPALRGVSEKKKRRLRCPASGCLLYEAVCRLFYRGRVKEKTRELFAFRLSDGYICGKNMNGFT